MIIHLNRFSYSPSETEGILQVGDERFFTIEKPWRGNLKGNSCVPEGKYEVAPFLRPSGEEAYILFNPALGVWRQEVDIPSGVQGRSLILIHAANFERQIQGCIAPGMLRGILKDSETGRQTRAVLSSRLAMENIREILGKAKHRIVISQVRGALHEG